MLPVGTLDPGALQPLFHSEISSSYILFSILRNHPDVARAFVDWAGVPDPSQIDTISREHLYPGQGSIDLLLTGSSVGRRWKLLVEVKVHDYLSATADQIDRYYVAARDEDPDTEVWFLYLTQLSQSNFPAGEGNAVPGTIKEVQKDTSARRAGRLLHRCWKEFHEFLEPFRPRLSPEEGLMTDLQRSWILAKVATDLATNRPAIVGLRSLKHYLEDISFDLRTEMPFGEERQSGARHSWWVALGRLKPDELDRVSRVILDLLQSTSLDRSRVETPTDVAMAAASELLQGLAADTSRWGLLGFYSTLFAHVLGSRHLRLNGTGGRGLSILATTTKHGLFSICTLWTRQHAVEFGLHR